MDVSEPSYTTNETGEFQAGTLYIYGLGFFFGFIVLILIFYLTYLFKRHMYSRMPPPPPTTNAAAAADNHRFLDDDVIMTFPTFAYSEVENTDDVSSGCSICLADYKPVDVIRLLPECGHLFHCKCIDTWLKVHPTCPVCRKSMLVEVV